MAGGGAYKTQNGRRRSFLVLGRKNEELVSLRGQEKGIIGLKKAGGTACKSQDERRRSL